MKIERASEMGFCFGVRRAINLVERAARERGPLESLGDIVHNRQVVARLAAQGLRVVESLDDLKGDIVAITSHGVGPQVTEALRLRGLDVVDATCPYVQRAQRAAQNLAGAGLFAIIFGDAHHPEVKGVLGWADGKGTATTELPLSLRPPKRVGLLSQTTQSPARFARFTGQLLTYYLPEELRALNTVCPSTRKRLASAKKLAKRVDFMIVVGGRESANTRYLARECALTGVVTHHVETAEDLDPSWLANHHRVGITAGASTPEEVIEEVIFKLKGIDRT